MVVQQGSTVYRQQNLGQGTGERAEPDPAPGRQEDCFDTLGRSSVLGLRISTVYRATHGEEAEFGRATKMNSTPRKSPGIVATTSAPRTRR